MPSPDDTARRRLLAWACLAWPSAQAMSTVVPTPPPPPHDARAVDWDHFGEPQLSQARNASVAVTRLVRERSGIELQPGMLLQRSAAAQAWAELLAHYDAQDRWRRDNALRGELPAGVRWQAYRADEKSKPGHRLWVLCWVPAAGASRDDLMLTLVSA
jgi:hypothetical protein